MFKFAVLAVFGELLAGCTQAPPPAQYATPVPEPVAAQQTAAAGAYGEALLQTVRLDPTLGQILANFHVQQQLQVGLVVDPNGFVEKGFMVRSSQPQPVEQAVLGHLININFGAFSPAMPQHKLVFLVPVDPPAGLIENSVFQMKSIVLYQPNQMLVARLGPNGAAGMANYISRINQSLAATFKKLPLEPGVSGAVVIGIKPPGFAREAWVVTGKNHFSQDLILQIKIAAEIVQPMPVYNGPVVFAINFNAWDGGVPVTDAKHPLPMPQEWFAGAAAGSKPALVPDGIFARIWP